MEEDEEVSRDAVKPPGLGEECEAGSKWAEKHVAWGEAAPSLHIVESLSLRHHFVIHVYLTLCDQRIWSQKVLGSEINEVSLLGSFSLQLFL